MHAWECSPWRLFIQAASQNTRTCLETSWGHRARASSDDERLLCSQSAKLQWPRQGVGEAERPTECAPPSSKMSLMGFISQVLLSSVSLKTSKPSNNQWLFQNAMCYSLALIKYFCHGAFEVLWTHGNKCARLMWSRLSLKCQSRCLPWSWPAHLHVDFRSHVPLSSPLAIPLLPMQTWMCIRIQAIVVRIHFSSNSST